MNTQVLCWGGPEHGKVRDIPNDKVDCVRFVLKRHPYSQDEIGSITTLLAIPSVKYSVRHVLVYDPIYAVVKYKYYPVLIYQENEERLWDNLDGWLSFICWLTRLGC